ncbi:MAG: polysaccharide deacetylase family protein, partial [Alphaproteobacteria bacterium]
YNPAPLIGRRDQNMESAYEYGSRVGVWRLLRLLESRGVPFTTYAVGRALELNPAAAAALGEADCDMVNHCWRWLDYSLMAEEAERADIAHGTDAIARLTGKRPRGYYAGMPSPNTRRLVMDHGGYDFDCDAYNDDIPYWVRVGEQPFLVIPGNLNSGDTRYARGHGFDLADDFYTYLKDSFDWLYAEGEETPRLLSVFLHCRVIAHPGRIAGLARLIDYMMKHDKVWFCQRSQIADHWIANHPPDAP